MTLATPVDGGPHDSRTIGKTATDRLAISLQPWEWHILENVTRREFVVGSLSLAALVACGDDRSSSSETTTSAATSTWALGPHGPVDVPRSPQRVVVGNSIDADFALALGLPLVGVPGTLGNAALPFADYHADRLDGVERVQTGGEPNLEQVLRVRPDVILDSWDGEKARFDGFAAIAPTVNFAPVLYPNNFERTDWPAALTALGELFDRRQEATDAIAAYDTVVDAGRGQLAALAGKTYAPINPFGAEGAMVIDQGQQIAQVASDLGLVPHGLVVEQGEERVMLSLEQLDQLATVDYLLLARYPNQSSLERDTESERPVVDSPLWATLPAVQDGRVVEYFGELYYASPITALQLAHQLIDSLASR